MRNLTISPEAEDDLQDQVTYFFEEEGSDLALRFLESLKTTLAFLCKHPDAGRLRKSSHIELNTLRSWRVDEFPNHLVFYRASAITNSVEVVRIVHGARDLKRVVKGLL